MQKPARLWNRTLRFALSLSPLFFSACGEPGGAQFPDSAAVATEAAALVSSTSPYAGTAVEGTLPPLNLRGILESPPRGVLIDENGVYEGTFSNGVDLNAPLLTSDRAAFRAACMSIPSAVAPALGTHLDSALAASEVDLDRLDGGVVRAAFARLAATVTEPAGAGPQKTFTGYTPARARWLKGGTNRLGGWDSYPDPNHFNELRQRGARLYCAAREARMRMGAASLTMGEQTAFSVNILGKRIEFLAVEPTVTLGDPEAFGTAASDGAQVFKIPLLMGTRITPIRGLGLPSLGEIRNPVVLITGDSEVETLSSAGTFLGRKIYRQHHHSLLHLDSAATTEQSINADKSVPLFQLGPLKVDLTLNLKLDIGKTERDNSRLWQGVPVGWPSVARVGWASTNALSKRQYHDGPWEPPAPEPDRGTLDSRFQYHEISYGYFSGAASLALSPSPPFNRSADPFTVRALQDDDHSLSTRTAITLNAGLRGSFLAEIGPFEAGLSVTGRLGGALGMRHLLRDSLYIQDNTPVAGLTVRPRIEADGWVDPLRAALTLRINLGIFGVINLDQVLFEVPRIALAHFDTDTTRSFGESSTLRIGTGSRQGNPMLAPDVSSHLPGGTEHASIPGGVGACLADTRPYPTEAPPCSPTVDSGSLPQVQLCMFIRPPLPLDGGGGFALPENVCSDIDGYATSLRLSTEGTECLRAAFQFQCASPSMQQTWHGDSVVSRVINLTDVTQMRQLGEIMNRCARGFVSTVGSPASIQLRAQDFFRGFYGAGACDASARLLTGAEVMSAEMGRTTRGPGTCH